MRLIDVDALEKFIDYGHLNNPNEKLYSENDIREMMDMMPTIEERKTGRWIEVSDDSAPINYACSVCYAGIKHQGFANYCPNCGAKMEVEHDIS